MFTQTEESFLQTAANLRLQMLGNLSELKCKNWFPLLYTVNYWHLIYTFLKRNSQKWQKWFYPIMNFLDQRVIFLCFVVATEVPSSPKIEEVQPFSSTAVVEFEEPFSLGGVPILKYRVEWRLPGKEWKSEEYKAKDGEFFFSFFFPECISNWKWNTDRQEDSFWIPRCAW